jgi:hypothetical protein
MKPAPFKSDFAILDVKRGRAALEKRIAKTGKVRVRVDMTIDYAHGNDDGTSIEFACTVHSVSEILNRRKPDGQSKAN